MVSRAAVLVWSAAFISESTALLTSRAPASRARSPMAAKVFNRLFSGGATALPQPSASRTLADAPGGAGGAPSWPDLKALAMQTPTGARLAGEDAERAQGGGPAHRASTLRLFGKSKEDVRVTFYRDSAAWCPYCQKVWLQLEEKRVPYRVELINMRSYGDKPEAFLRRVPGGLLPAIELDGQLITESLVIMQRIEQAFPHAPSLLPTDARGLERANALLRLERELFSDWCQLTFRPGLGAQRGFEATLGRVEAALGETDGPWLLGGERPSLVDLQYVSHVERMAASVPYWKGLPLRAYKGAKGAGRWPRIEAWLEAFEQRQCYVASKSDWYTHVKDIPPQYGPGQSAGECAPYAASIDGRDGSWSLPLPPLAQSPYPADQLQPGWEPQEAGAAHEAAWRLLANPKGIARFALRGAGAPGAKQFGAELADPYATPAEGPIEADVDLLLRHVVGWLLDARERPDDGAFRAAVGGGSADGRAALAACAAYLRDRVGVPRDMSYPAARQLRAHLNWAIERLGEA